MGFGFGFGGQASSSRLTAGTTETLRPQASQGAMRDSYVTSRLAPHINDFVSTAMSYMPYFSYRTDPTAKPLSSTQTKDKPLCHPTESFEFLSTLTNHLVAQPPLVQASLLPQILPRLLQEWRAWVDRVDCYVNKEAGMFGLETAQSWIRALDNYAVVKWHGVDREMEAGLRSVRDKWVAQVGWLVGRSTVLTMDEEEEEEEL